MGPCHSSSKKKPIKDQNSAPQEQKDAVIPQLQQPQMQMSPVKENPQINDLNQNQSPLKMESPQKEINPNEENTPNKFHYPGSSGMKPNDRYDKSESQERSNILSKHEPNPNQEMKMGSHFYYSQKENDSGKLAEEKLKNFEYEEHEFKEPADYKTSLHSTQLNRREIFSEFNKNKFIQSKNTGDSDEPEEIIFEEVNIL